MKFEITITKEIIDESLYCGVAKKMSVADNWAFAKAYNKLIPNVSVTLTRIYFYGNEYVFLIDSIPLELEQKYFIYKFDSYKNSPEKRYELVGEKFIVEIPDSVINYWYSDKMEEVYKILENQNVLSVVE